MEHETQDRSSNANELMLQEFEILDSEWIGFADALSTDEAASSGRWIACKKDDMVEVRS